MNWGRFTGCRLAFAVPIFCGGCVPLLLPINVGLDLALDGAVLDGSAGAVLREVDGQDDVFWLEIERVREPGSVGGFISPIDEHRGALLLLLHGASTFQEGGEVDAARRQYTVYGEDFRLAGFLTWSLAVRECPTPYGDGDLKDALEVIDWLEREGKEFLAVERVYIVGYSTGATVANLLNTQREVTAIVSLGGLTQPDQLEAFFGFYSLLADVFPQNVGFCQLDATLRAYGPPGSPEWEALNVVDRLAEFRSPMLLVHGTSDQIYFVENTRSLEARYRALSAAQVENLPELEFLYVPGGDHFMLVEDPDLQARVIDYLLRFEAAATGDS